MSDILAMSSGWSLHDLIDDDETAIIDGDDAPVMTHLLPADLLKPSHQTRNRRGFSTNDLSRAEVPNKAFSRFGFSSSMYLLQ